jgi:hypothetical protein
LLACGASETEAPLGTQSCEPGTKQACYSGPADSEGVGDCRAGVRVCLSHGRGFGACEGEVTPAAEDCGREGDENCDGIATCGDTLWNVRIGSDLDEAPVDIDSDPEGNLFVTGSYRAPLDLGGGPLSTSDDNRDIFIAKLDAIGAHVFSRAIHGQESLTGRNVAVAPDGGVAVAFGARGAMTIDGGSSLQGAGNFDVGLLWLDASGQELHAAVWGDADEQQPNGLAFDADNNLIVSGFFRGTLDFGLDPHMAVGAERDVFVVKLGADGEPLWSTSFNGSDEDVSRAVAVDRTDGSIYVCGDARYDLTIGSEVTMGGVDTDVFVAKLDADGQVLWSRRWGDSTNQEPYGIAVDGERNVFVVGGFSGRMELGSTILESPGGDGIFVIKLDPSGTISWARALGGGANQRAYDVMIDQHGRLVLAGYYEGFATIGESPLPESGISEPAIFVAKLEPDGTDVWARGVVVHGDQSTNGVARAWRGVALGPEDKLWFAGFAEGALDLGQGPLEPFGGTDLVLALLAP